MLVLCARRRHRVWRTCVTTEWGLRAGLSLGPFVFVPAEADGAYEGPGPARQLRAHEYGHTLQSLLLGPLYLVLIVLPSLVWAGMPYWSRWRVRRGFSYYRFYPEAWANKLARRVTGEDVPA